jgi:ATP-dependent RNA circularization protein (DNA/RNA ligase family)
MTWKDPEQWNQERSRNTLNQAEPEAGQLINSLFDMVDRADQDGEIARIASDVCANKHGGNSESQAANEQVEPRKHEDCRRILAFLRQRGDLGATVKEVSKGLPLHYTTASARLSDLKVQNLITRKGEERREGCAVLILVNGGTA